MKRGGWLSCLLMWPSLALGGELRVEAWKQDATNSRVKVGAEIMVNGEPTGLVTPAVVRDLAEGTHLIELKSGCAFARETVEITAQGRAQLKVDLETQPAKLTITLQPEEARLQLDGRELEVTAGDEIHVECGPHTLSASLEGYKTTLSNLDLAPGEIQDLRIDLQPLGKGTIQVMVEPETARILLNGEDVGKGDLELEVFQGPHVVEATLRGHAPQQDTFFVAADETYTVEMALELLPERPEKVLAIERHPVFSSKTKALGYGLSALGAGVLVYGGTQLLQTMSAYQEYEDRVATVNSGLQDPAYAKDFYDAEVATRAPRMRASLGLGATALTGGLVLAVRF